MKQRTDTKNQTKKIENENFWKTNREKSNTAISQYWKKMIKLIAP